MCTVQGGQGSQRDNSYHIHPVGQKGSTFAQLIQELQMLARQEFLQRIIPTHGIVPVTVEFKQLGFVSYQSLREF
jgi:hypothetical protein